ncbi:MAG: hypothetical protein KIT20_01780 [Alphaproteobacteria bacterium]|nr:hypothetical protein [Alphaproteobacteria bacterium]
MSRIGVQDLLDAMPGVSYLVDCRARIVAVGASNWRKFANDNDGAALADPASVVGRDLFSMIDGEDVRQRYDGMLRRLLAGETSPLRFTYRCDSAVTRRLMLMSMSAVFRRGRPAGALFQSLTLDQTTRPALPLFGAVNVLDALQAQRSWPIVRVCSFCARVLAPDGQDWIDAEDYYRAGGSSMRIRVSHGICPACVAAGPAEASFPRWRSPPSPAAHPE